jgi:imidazolonepropionase-like amidohydrolase
MMRGMKPAPRLLVRAVDVLDVRRGDVVRRQDLLLEDGHIRRIGPSFGTTPAGVEVVEGAGLLAMPGLIDCHVHVLGFFLQQRPGWRDAGWLYRQIARNLRFHLFSGVTMVRDTGGPARLLRWWRRRIEGGHVPGPRLLCAGPLLTAPGGYPGFMPVLPEPVARLIGQSKRELSDPDAARRAVDTVLAEGADWLKVAYCGRDYDEHLGPCPILSEPVLSAIVDEAHRRGRKVAAHVTWLADWQRIVRLGLDSLEHLPRDRVLDAATLDALAASATTVVPTISNMMNFVHLQRLLGFFQRDDARSCLEPVPRAWLERQAAERRAGLHPPHRAELSFEALEDTNRRNARALIARGVSLALGTDAGAFYGFFGDIATELQWLVELGMSPLEAVRNGTTRAARLLGLEGKAGALEEGAWADLLLVRGDPREDIGVLRRPSWVVAGGRPYRVEHLMPLAGDAHFPCARGLAG